MPAKKPANKGKVCVRRARGANGKMRCAKFGAGPAKAKRTGGGKRRRAS